MCCSPLIRTLGSGTYKAEFEVTYADKTVEITPNSESIVVKVVPEIGCTPIAEFNSLAHRKKQVSAKLALSSWKKVDRGARCVQSGIASLNWQKLPVHLANERTSFQGIIPIMIKSARWPQKLYLDLMEKALTNTIYGDQDIKPRNQGRYSFDDRSTGKDWPSQAHTMIGLKRLHNTRVLAERAIQNGIPGDFIETGVWRGGACVMMRAVCEAYGESSRKIICADSFEGLPPPNAKEYPADTGDKHHTVEILSVSMDDVKNAFSAYGLLDDQVEFLKGWFKDTLPGLERSFAIVRLDGDMYESTIQGLDALYHRLSSGGFLIVDDYGAVPACRQAVQEFREKNSITEEMHPIDWTGVWWRKS